jgi:hypothetical protein
MKRSGVRQLAAAFGQASLLAVHRSAVLGVVKGEQARVLAVALTFRSAGKNADLKVGATKRQQAAALQSACFP